ncbi:MAG: cytochrome c3 family protein, partial [Acidobacteria bacterium]|nr:cytochrome c3 family protein [Acidobacteriota bacterium]
VTVVLGVGLAFTAVFFGLSVSLRLPGNQQGYEPTQPIAYSHRLHAQELQIGCLYCHFGAETSRHAGIPPANVCMNCHRFVIASLGAIRAEHERAQQENRQPQTVVSPELGKLYEAMGLNQELRPDPAKPTHPLAWVRVHKLPDYVYFDHRAHVNAGVECQRCHGPVETMERVRQVEDLSMGWCVNCHREVNQTGVAGKPVDAPIYCDTCHY